MPTGRVHEHIFQMFLQAAGQTFPSMERTY